MRRRAPRRPKKEPDRGREVGMSPAIENDTGDIALCIKSGRAEHFRHLLANLTFEIDIRGREQLRPAKRPLDRGVLAWVQERNVEGEDNRAVGGQWRWILRKPHVSTHADMPAKASKPAGGGKPELVEKAPVPNRDISGQDGPIAELT